MFLQAQRAQNMKIARERAEKREQEVGWIMNEIYNVAGTASFALEQSFLRGANDLLRALNPRDPYATDKWMANFTTQMMSLGIPNTAMSVLRARREWMPEKRGDTGQQKLELSVAEKMQSLTSLWTGKVEPWDFGAPVKQGAFGKPIMQTPEGASPIWYNMLDITKAAPAQADATEIELYHLWRRSGDRAVLPREPGRQFTFRKQVVPLNRDEHATFRHVVGHYQKFLVDQLMVQPTWTHAPDERKIKMIRRAYDRGGELGKRYYIRNYLNK